MGNYAPSTRQRIADINLGLRVDRATDDIPHTTTETLFNVVGGKVLMTMLVGECTVDVAGAIVITLAHDPDTGDTANLCAATTITAVNAGDVITLPASGLLTDTMVPATQAASVHKAYSGVILTAGIITLYSNGTQDGNFKWSLFYVPLDTGAYVTAEPIT